MYSTVQYEYIAYSTPQQLLVAAASLSMKSTRVHEALLPSSFFPQPALPLYTSDRLLPPPLSSQHPLVQQATTTTTTTTTNKYQPKGQKQQPRDRVIRGEGGAGSWHLWPRFLPHPTWTLATRPPAWWGQTSGLKSRQPTEAPNNVTTK